MWSGSFCLVICKSLQKAVLLEKVRLYREAIHLVIHYIQIYIYIYIYIHTYIYIYLYNMSMYIQVYNTIQHKIGFNATLLASTDSYNRTNQGLASYLEDTCCNMMPMQHMASLICLQESHQISPTPFYRDIELLESAIVFLV